MTDEAKLARISEIMIAWVNRGDEDESSADVYLENIMEALDGRTINGLPLSPGGDA
jgi:hypothetical protein